MFMINIKGMKALDLRFCFPSFILASRGSVGAGLSNVLRHSDILEELV